MLNLILSKIQHLKIAVTPQMLPNAPYPLRIRLSDLGAMPR